MTLFRVFSFEKYLVIITKRGRPIVNTHARRVWFRFVAQFLVKFVRYLLHIIIEF